MAVVNPAEPVDYTKVETPSSYKCGKCGAAGVKLWRDYQTFVCYQSLLCLDCACKEQDKTRTVTEDGLALYTGEVHHWYRTSDMPIGYWSGYDPKDGPPQDAIETKSQRVRTDQIGFRVPAVPTEENDTFWGYTSVPEAGCIWWGNLPTRMEKAA